MSFKLYNPNTGKWSSRADQRDVVHVIMDITPEIAAEWLKERNTNNRKQRIGMTNKYVTAIMTYGWYQTNHAIGFYRDGTLSDGQHTLMAVVLTQMPIRYTATFNITSEASDVIDDNGKRSTPDHARILYGDKASPLALNTMNYTLSVHGVQSKITKRQEMKFYEKNKELLEKINETVCKVGKTKKVTVSPVLSAIFTALKAEIDPVDEATGIRFLEVLCGSRPKDDREGYVTGLREWLISQTQTEKGADRSLTFWQTQKVLQKFALNKETQPWPKGPRISKDKSKRKPLYLIANGNIPHPQIITVKAKKSKKTKQTKSGTKEFIVKLRVEEQG